MRATLDEEALAGAVPRQVRRARGVYFTPAALAEHVLERCARLLPAESIVVDPACGAGAFVSAAERLAVGARRIGLELDPQIAAQCRARAASAEILEGDFLRGGLEALEARLPEGAFELWVGNPPYNGTSPLLSDAAAYRALRARLPSTALPSGTSLRDDFAFFLLGVASRLSTRAGAMAFVTPSSLMDSFLYAPVRRALLDALALVEVIELGGGVFQGARVKTCVTVWSTGARGKPAYVRRSERGSGFSVDQLSPPSAFEPAAPAWILRPADPVAEALDEAWRQTGEPLSTLVPVSFPGLKTRFDELLVDADPDRLADRVREFLSTRSLDAFARRHALPDGLRPKLEALAAYARAHGARFDRARVRPFIRYAGARHRGGIPAEARAFCYLDRALIPRGDHRLRGSYDPNADPLKLVFNARERPLSAILLEEEGCVHDHQHTRFAPAHVPRSLWETRGRGAARGEPVVNLSERGRAVAQRAGGTRAVFAAIVDFINSSDVQERWAPAFAATRELCVPIEALLATHGGPGEHRVRDVRAGATGGPRR